jgi:uncharacterized damage-inducible protein DinB
MLEQVRRMYDHVAWADHRAIQSLRTATAPPVKALEIMSHVLGAEDVWLARVNGRQATLAVWPSLDLSAVGGEAERIRAAYGAFVANLDDNALERHVRYRNSAGAEFVSRLDDILIHVALHGAYHRGQVALLVRQAGDAPEPTDYIAFVRGAPAATRT